ncbi:hypothetical protein V6N13_024773 [Hibiscus sabdariffa]
MVQSEHHPCRFVSIVAIDISEYASCYIGSSTGVGHRVFSQGHARATCGYHGRGTRRSAVKADAQVVARQPVV